MAGCCAAGADRLAFVLFLTALATRAAAFLAALLRDDSLIKSSKDSTPKASASLFCNKPGNGSFLTLLLYCFAPLTPRLAILPTNLPINACFRSSVLISNPTFLGLCKYPYQDLYCNLYCAASSYPPCEHRNSFVCLLPWVIS